MNNMWKLSNYLFAWQWKKWNKGVLTSTFIWIILMAFSLCALVHELIKLFEATRSGGEMLWNYQ